MRPCALAAVFSNFRSELKRKRKRTDWTRFQGLSFQYTESEHALIHLSEIIAADKTSLKAVAPTSRTTCAADVLINKPSSEAHVFFWTRGNSKHAGRSYLFAATCSLLPSSPPPTSPPFLQNTGKHPILIVPGERQVLVITWPPIFKDRDIRHTKNSAECGSQAQSTLDHGGTSSTLKGSTKTSRLYVCREWDKESKYLLPVFQNQEPREPGT